MSQLILPGSAAAADVLTGKSFSAGANYGAAGSMPNNGAVTITPGPNAQAIPAGYHNGSGSVPGVTVPAANVLTGTTIAGTAGTMPNNGAVAITPSGSAQAIPAGYHNGSGSVAAVVVPVANVLAGTTIAGQAGTMPNRGAPTITPGTANQGLSAGYYSGGTVLGDADLIAANILSGVNIFGVVGSVAKRLFASGAVTSASGGVDFISSSGGLSTYYPVTVSGLSFQPYLIVAYAASTGNVIVYANGDNMYSPGANPTKIITARVSTNGVGAVQLVSPASVSSTGFTLPGLESNTTYTWYAMG